jgi:hypothetical protein
MKYDKELKKLPHAYKREGRRLSNGKREEYVEYRIKNEAVHLNPSQRAAIFTEPPQEWDESGYEDTDKFRWANMNSREHWPIPDIAMQHENFQGYFNVISSWHRAQWKLSFTTSEKYFSEGEDRTRLRKKVPFWPAMDYPMGMLFSSQSLLSLAWAEIYWCMTNNIMANYCKGCGLLFASKNGAKVHPNSKCRETAAALEDGRGQELKDGHQILKRNIPKVKNNEVSLGEYIALWQQYEKKRSKSNRKKRNAWVVHPANVALQSPEGKRFITAIRDAEYDPAAKLKKGWDNLWAWMDKNKIPISDKVREWVQEAVLPPRQPKKN